VRAFAFELKRDVLHAADACLLNIDDVGFPFAAFGVAAVHSEQFAREQLGLFAACGSAYLNENVLFVVGVFVQEQHANLGFQVVASLLGVVEFFLQKVALGGVRYADHLFGGGDIGEFAAILFIGHDHVAQFVLGFDGLGVTLVIAAELRIVDLNFDVVEL